MGSFLESIFGGKPSVPKLPKLDLGTEQQKAISENIAALPQSETLASSVNLFNQSQINQMLAQAGVGTMQADAAAQIDKMLKGELPLSDVQQSHLGSVAQSFKTGTAGSGSMGNLVARDLGIREVDLIGKGLSSAESWLRTTASLYQPGMMDVTKMFITPAQQYAADWEQTQAQFQREWMKSNVEAMPDPVLSGINAEIMSLMNSFVGGLGGGMGGGGGGYKGGWGGTGSTTSGASNMTIPSDNYWPGMEY